MRIRDRSLIIMLSQGLTQATTLILGIILVRLVSKQTVGTYRQVMLVYMFLAGVLSLQLNHSLFYFIPKLGTEKRRTLLIQTLLFTLVMAFLVAVIMFFGSNYIGRRFNNPDLMPLIKIFALYPFVERVLILIPAFMISIDRPLRAGIYTLLTSTGRIAAVVTTLAMEYPLSTVMWAIVIVGGVIALAGCCDMMHRSPRGQWRISTSLLREQFDYSWPLLITAVVGTINIELNKVLISLFFDPDTYAVYSCGAMQLPIVTLVTISVSSAMMPNLVSLIENKKMPEALNMWQEATRKCSLIIFPCFAFFLIAGHDFIVLIFTQDYVEADWPFRIFLFTLPIRVAIYATLFRAAGQTGPVAVGAFIVLLLNVVIGVLLVIAGQGGFLSFIGPSLATVIANWGGCVYMLGKITKITSTPFSKIIRWKELSIFFVVSAIAALVVWIIPLPTLPLIIKLLLQAIIYSMAFIGVILGAKLLKEDEIQLLKWPINIFRQSRQGPKFGK